MIERPPRKAVLTVLIAPAHDREFLLHGRTGVPDVGIGALAGGGMDHVPELRGPAEDPEMFIGPVIRGPAHRVALVPREVLEDRMDHVVRQRGAVRAEFLPRPDIARRQRRIALRARRPEQYPTARVVGVVAADVRPGDDGPYECVDLGFAQWVIAGAGDASAPTGGEVAVHVEALRWPRRRDGEPVVVRNRAFAQHPVALRAFGDDSVDRHRHHHPGLIGVLDPRAVGIGDAHRQHPSVAIDVVFEQARPAVRIPVRPRTHTAAPKRRRIGERGFDPVGVDPRNDIERARPEGPQCHLVVAFRRGDEVMEQMQSRRPAGDLHRVDVRIHPVRRFRVVGTRRRIGDVHDPQRAALERGAVLLQCHERRVLGGEFVQNDNQLVVAHEAIKGHWHAPDHSVGVLS